MGCFEYERQIAALRQGDLRLPAPEEKGLSLYAGRSFLNLEEYVVALEHGYRAVCEVLDLYRKPEMNKKSLYNRGKSQQQMVEKPWSEDACLGYAVMGMRGAGLPPADAVRVLEVMQEAMSLYDLEAAAEAHQAIMEDAY